MLTQEGFVQCVIWGAYRDPSTTPWLCKQGDCFGCVGECNCRGGLAEWTSPMLGVSGHAGIEST